MLEELTQHNISEIEIYFFDIMHSNQQKKKYKLKIPNYIKKKMFIATIKL